MDSEAEKEKKQGNMALFDLSYLSVAIRQSVVGIIHHTYPNSAITLEYDTDGKQLHITWPIRYELHRGEKAAAWYH